MLHMPVPRHRAGVHRPARRPDAGDVPRPRRGAAAPALGPRCARSSSVARWARCAATSSRTLPAARGVVDVRPCRRRSSWSPDRSVRAANTPYCRCCHRRQITPVARAGRIPAAMAASGSCPCRVFFRSLADADDQPAQLRCHYIRARYLERFGTALSFTSASRTTASTHRRHCTCASRPSTPPRHADHGRVASRSPSRIACARSWCDISAKPNGPVPRCDTAHHRARVPDSRRPAVPVARVGRLIPPGGS